MNEAKTGVTFFRKGMPERFVGELKSADVECCTYCDM